LGGGLFDSVSAAANIPFARFNLIYAENARGKTTLASILRSLASGDPIPIAEGRRLAAQHPPHVILDCSGGPPPAMFRNNAWTRTLSNLAVFDDTFVDQNVYSGLAVEAGHRQNPHDLILGAQAVLLNQQLQQLGPPEQGQRGQSTILDKSARSGSKRSGIFYDFAAANPRGSDGSAVWRSPAPFTIRQPSSAVSEASPLYPLNPLLRSGKKAVESRGACNPGSGLLIHVT
jgi:hypothetical protein